MSLYLSFKIKYLLLFILEDEPSCEIRKINYYKNSVFLTIGGATGLGSINYERRLGSRGSVSLWGHAGLGTFKIIDFRNRLNPDLLIPVGLYCRVGQQKHSAIAGIGSVLNHFVMAESAKAVRNTSIGFFAKLGYRFTFNKNRTYLQLTYTPILNRNNYIHNWAGCCLAYTF